MSIVLVVVVTFIATTLFEAIVFYIQHKRYTASYNKEKKSFEVARKIDNLLLQKTDSTSTIQRLADFLPNELDFATGVIALYDEPKGVIRRVAASNTTEAAEAIKALSIPFAQIAIPVGDENNLMAKALRERKEFFTTNVDDVFIPVLSSDESEKIQQIMSTQLTIVYPIFISDKPLGVFIASSKKRYLSEYEKDIIGVFVDGAGIALQNSQLFTSLETTTNDLKIANERLQKVDEMKDEFISIASHDLRTPLTVVKDYLYLVAKELNNHDTVDVVVQNINTAQKATEHAINLVNDMLDVSRIEAGRIMLNITSFNLFDLMAEIVNELKITGQPKKITLDFQADSVLAIKADIDRTRQIIVNLISNSIKYTPTGGLVKVYATKVNNEIHVSVSDNGIGIKAEDLSKLFTKFGRLDNSLTGVAKAPGTGLGLYITRKLVELQGGKIWVESEYGKGSKFIFTLPSA
ncbi:MAG TPA: GAF domain-containing sensor histidine kinase [Patescibacteria group bacterium]|nr:GAF domain-containing sensor histidine kinase [Patescibacteria group bacterium]